MEITNVSLIVRGAVVVACLGLPHAAATAAWTETVLKSFSSGDLPDTDLVFDGAGNLFAETRFGGTYRLGTAFELSPPAAGKKVWTETVLHNFSGADGAGPTSWMIFDAAG